jgi:hypothetical protein
MKMKPFFEVSKTIFEIAIQIAIFEKHDFKDERSITLVSPYLYA